MTERRRLDRTAWLTTIPLVALILAELWTWLDRRPGGTVSETVWWALGDQGRPWWWLLSGALLAFLAWMAAHFVLIGPACGWRHLLILLGAGILAGAGLYLVR